MIITKKEIDGDGTVLFNIEEENFESYLLNLHLCEEFEHAEYIRGFHEAKEHVINLFLLAHNEKRDFYWSSFHIENGKI